MRWMPLYFAVCLAAQPVWADMAGANAQYGQGRPSEALGMYLGMAQDEKNSPVLRARAYQGAGNCYLKMEQPANAQQAYQQSLFLDANNPALDTFVKQLKGKAGQDSPEVQPSSPPPGTSPDWAWYGLESAILPGWGQWSAGEHGKALIMGGATLAAAGLALYYFGQEQAAQSHYDSVFQGASSNNPSSLIAADAAFQQVSLDSLCNNIFACAAAGLYLGTLWDALRGSSSFNHAFAGAPSPAPAAARLQVLPLRQGAMLSWKQNF